MRLTAFLSWGISFWNLKKKNFLLQNMRKMTHLFFHDASILVSVGVFLTHRFETVGVFAHFLCVKNAKTPSIWSSDVDSSGTINRVCQQTAQICFFLYGLKVGSCPNNDNFVQIFICPFLSSI